jgi:hypothetical protein
LSVCGDNSLRFSCGVLSFQNGTSKHFLELVEIGDFFSDELYSQIPLDHRVTQFCDYVVENYIDDESIFPPSMWASTTDSMHRTTNSCESFHNKFNSNFYSSHPNIFAFLDILLNFQAETYVKINSAQRCVKKLRCNTKKKQEFIKTTIELYKSGNLSRLHFVKKLSFYYLP